MKAAGVNPLIHYLTFGVNEGRVAFPEDLSDTNGADNRVDLNATVGTSAGVNTTWGGWATASYCLVSDNSNGGFKIDFKTGAVTVADASKFTASITYEITVRRRSTETRSTRTSSFQLETVRRPCRSSRRPPRRRPTRIPRRS